MLFLGFGYVKCTLFQNNADSSIKLSSASKFRLANQIQERPCFQWVKVESSPKLAGLHPGAGSTGLKKFSDSISFANLVELFGKIDIHFPL